MSTVRIRQLVVLVADLERADREHDVLRLGPAFVDPHVAAFGVRNVVRSLGDAFLELVVPLDPAAPNGPARALRERGEGGLMLILQVDDHAAARERLREHGVRITWESPPHPDIAALHLHPKDTGGGVLLSLDQATPPETWRWGGPAWTGAAPPVDGRRIAAVRIASGDPEARAARWADVLGVPRAGARLTLAAGGAIVFVPGAVERIVGVDVVAPGAEPTEPLIAGVRWSVRGTDHPTDERTR